MSEKIQTIFSSDAEIEARACIRLLPVALSSGSETGFTIVGMPIQLVFEPALTAETYDRIMRDTFDTDDDGGLRIGGTSVNFQGRLAHVYGIDYETWTPINLEMAPEYFTIMLVEGSRFTTVRRLVHDLKRYTNSAIVVYVGDECIDIEGQLPSYKREGIDAK